MIHDLIILAILGGFCQLMETLIINNQNQNQKSNVKKS